MEFSSLEQQQLIEYVESLRIPGAPTRIADNMIKLGDQWYELCRRDDVIWVIPSPFEKPIKICVPQQEDEKC
jgi:hypothetical protein